MCSNRARPLLLEPVPPLSSLSRRRADKAAAACTKLISLDGPSSWACAPIARVPFCSHPSQDIKRQPGQNDARVHGNGSRSGWLILPPVGCPSSLCTAPPTDEPRQTVRRPSHITLR